jgi:hypothetical protein
MHIWQRTDVSSSCPTFRLLSCILGSHELGVCSATHTGALQTGVFQPMTYFKFISSQGYKNQNITSLRSKNRALNWNIAGAYNKQHVTNGYVAHYHTTLFPTLQASAEQPESIPYRGRYFSLRLPHPDFPFRQNRLVPKG